MCIFANWNTLSVPSIQASKTPWKVTNLPPLDGAISYTYRKAYLSELNIVSLDRLRVKPSHLLKITTFSLLFLFSA